MAVIEEESASESVSRSQPNPEAAAPSGHCSDGYETASDSELNDSDKDNVPDNRNDLSSVKNVDDVSREINEGEGKTETTETEANEKRLAKANDAKLEGNSLFKAGEYEEALSKYEIAIQVSPDAPSSSEIRSICHANRAACFAKLGKLEETVKECTKALELNPTYIKALLRRGEAREKLEQYEESIADMTKILELDPSNDQARRNIIRLKPLADEKREKMKEEMIGKLKEMGNSILGRFGMSVDNFKAVKDPNTGSYSEFPSKVSVERRELHGEAESERPKTGAGVAGFFGADRRTRLECFWGWPDRRAGVAGSQEDVGRVKKIVWSPEPSLVFILGHTIHARGEQLAACREFIARRNGSSSLYSRRRLHEATAVDFLFSSSRFPTEIEAAAVIEVVLVSEQWPVSSLARRLFCDANNDSRNSSPLSRSSSSPAASWFVIEPRGGQTLSREPRTV
ncbi:Tetratricopeptide repeat (TPR)-like superfamily protein [Striga hermonthica]|uniref:Tetratricopeptide repeat (TPR)-like superfamily protein n=1 Tax=Striga hermonthica TaxID=68872 RepID=A0A9N7MCE5_STRHE|nr:Tetratricopeptide repeat (TPR)-like superfamily protein [Striga hermonthica]